MRLDLSAAGSPWVTLSERNLVALLAKLQRGGAVTIVSGNVYGDGQLLEGASFVLHAERDDDHYGKRGFPPGPMRPETERLLRVIRDALADDAQTRGQPEQGEPA